MKLTQEILNQAMQAFSAGNFTQVISILSPAYKQHPLAKMVYATALGKVAEFKKSFEIFESLQSDYPQNTDVAYNYGLLLKEAGFVDDAQRQFSKAIAINSNYHVALHALGNLKSELEQYEEAQLAFEKALAKDPKNVRYSQSLGKCLYQQEKWALLIAHTKVGNLYQSDRLSAELYTEACYRIHSRFELNESSSLLSSKYPDSYPIHYFLFLSALESKRYVLAKQYLEISLSVASASNKNELITYSSYITWLLNPSSENLDILNRRLASTKNERLLELAFNINENMGNLAGAETFLNKIQSLEGKSNRGKGELKRSLLAVAKDDFEEGLLLIEHYLESQPLSLPHLYQKVRILEKLGRYCEVEEVIRHIARNLKSLNSSKFSDLTAGVSFNDFKVSPVPIEKTSDNQTNILFIVGFPRSGTTLVESLMLKHMDIELLEETDAVNTFYTRMVEDGIVDKDSGNVKIDSESELTALADEYLAHLSTYSPTIDETKLIVDKMPLNIPYLPAMLTLFPRAKVLFCLRNPKAVALSCLQFEEINLYTIEQFSAAYNSVFSCWEKVQDVLGSRSMSVKYEDIINDTDHFIDTAYRFMQPTGSFKKRNKSDNSSLVLTPSYFQVNKPIYQSSADKYLYYPTLFSKVPSDLDKWIKKLKY